MWFQWQWSSRLCHNIAKFEAGTNFSHHRTNTSDKQGILVILAIIEQILQTNKEFGCWGFRILAVHICMPQGGKSNENPIPLGRFIKKKRFIAIRNKTKLGRALVVAIAHANTELETFDQLSDPIDYQRQKKLLQPQEYLEISTRSQIWLANWYPLSRCPGKSNLIPAALVQN